MDEFCGNCGARLAPTTEWCTQCFTPVVRRGAGQSPPSTAPHPTAPTSATEPLPALEAGPTGTVGGMPRIFEDPRTGKMAAPGETTYYNPPEFSRWKGGPSSLGPGAKIFMSLLLILVVIGAFTLVHGGIYALTGFLVPANQLRIIYAIVTAPLTACFLGRIWKRTRVS